jgi:hypothetical protein
MAVSEARTADVSDATARGALLARLEVVLEKDQRPVNQSRKDPKNQEANNLSRPSLPDRITPLEHQLVLH